MKFAMNLLQLGAGLCAAYAIVRRVHNPDGELPISMVVYSDWWLTLGCFCLLAVFVIRKDLK